MCIYIYYTDIAYYNAYMIITHWTDQDKVITNHLKAARLRQVTCQSLQIFEPTLIGTNRCRFPNPRL